MSMSSKEEENKPGCNNSARSKSYISIPADVLYQYELFSRYNSPYTAHEQGSAIDLYPPGNKALSPVGGEVIDIQTVKGPAKPYAVEKDHLIIIDTESGNIEFQIADNVPALARIMHVKPEVSAGDQVQIGDSLGQLVRAGFFAPWVENHLHLGFRAPGANYLRASGSLPLKIDINVEPLTWKGRGRVKEAGETYVVLDSPRHPYQGEAFVAIADDSGSMPLDGGLPHFSRGGMFSEHSGSVKLLGTEIGTVEAGYVDWKPVQVYANGKPITGLSLFAAQTDWFGARLVCPEASFEPGEPIKVEIRRANF